MASSGALPGGRRLSACACAGEGGREVRVGWCRGQMEEESEERQEGREAGGKRGRREERQEGTQREAAAEHLGQDDKTL